MKILQMHADFIEYEPVKKEIASAEEAAPGKVRKDDIVVLFTAVEKGDDATVAKKAVAETKKFLANLGATSLLIYPFAHLSQDLARPAEAIGVLDVMEAEANASGLVTSRAPFGWTKALQIKVKGHPLAEMSRSYSASQKELALAVGTRPHHELTEREAKSRLKRSDFANLPDTDHRTIGERQDLFSFQEVSPGMVYWHDKGLRIRNILVEFLRDELRRRNHVEISSPALANVALWMVSGHSEHYKDNMFLTSLGSEELGLKPMNCPSTFLVYKSRKWSFRELPVRYAVFDSLYRNELSGVASGLFRVKVFSQDDAHVICTEEQAEAELNDMLDMMEKVYGVFKLEYRAKVSTRPDESMGTKEEWDRATATLIRVLESRKWKYEVKEKEGNFYAPKIDVDIKDSLGREWQCGTFQLDLQMPKRFDLSYTGSDGKEHTPVVLHRTILGSLERFIGVILEHYNGALPLWLSPVQVRVIPLSEEHKKYASKVLDQVGEAGLRAEGDFESGTIGAKIRNAQLLKIPYMVVVGKKEEDSKTISVRLRTGEQSHGVKVKDFVEELTKKARDFS